MGTQAPLPAFLRTTTTNTAAADPSHESDGMAPRAKASAETAEPTRRSTRISAQPKTEPLEKPAKKAAAPKTKKRAADVVEGEGAEDVPAVKKVNFRFSSGFWR